MKRWIRRIAISLVMLAVVALGCGGALMHTMRQWDVQHTKFLSSGKTINDFLKEFAGTVGEAFQDQHSDKVVQHYSQRYASPQRGTWALDQGQDIGDADFFQLVAGDQLDYGRDDIGRELQGYFADIQSVDRVKCKINLIETIEPN